MNSWSDGHFTAGVVLALALALGALNSYAFKAWLAPWTMELARKLGAAACDAPGWRRAPTSVTGTVVGKVRCQITWFDWYVV